MSFVSLSAVRALIPSALPDTELQSVIDSVEGELIERIGPFQTDGSVEITERGIVSRRGEVFARQPIAALVSLTVDGNVIAESDIITDYYPAGAIAGIALYSRPGGYILTYRPAARPATIARAIIDLVRLEVARTAMKSESVAGEYSYQAPEWESERLKIIRRVTLREF